MQTDAWLTGASYPDRCPLCSQPLRGVSNICPACGFTAHEPVGQPAPQARPSTYRQPNPLTPIPARASARRAQSRPGGVRRQTDATSSATDQVQQGSGWQHESSHYEAVSSLSALSLIISETPTAPPRSTGRLEHIDEIDTIPQTPGRTRAVQPVSRQVPALPLELPETPLPASPPALSFNDIDVSSLALVLSETTPPVPYDEIDTVPEGGSTSSRALAPLPVTVREVTVNAASWTPAGSTRSLAADFVTAHAPRRRQARNFTPLDRTRWWLLRPGHIEFLLWTAGSVLLFGVTFVLLLATVLSVMLPGLQSSGNFPSSATTTTPVTSTTPAATVASLHLTLTGKAALVPGAEMHLQGAGFQPQSTIVFLLDGRLALLDRSGKAASTLADKTGHFSVDLWLGQGAAWTAGSHQILARETTSGHQSSVTITITSSPASTGGVQTTPTLPAPTPVRPTPVPPTPTQVRPTPTPTQGVTPTPTPAQTASPVVAGGTATPARSTTAGSSSLGNSLNGEDDNSLVGRLGHLNPLVWLIGLCYFISVIFLGLAGLLRRRR